MLVSVESSTKDLSLSLLHLIKGYKEDLKLFFSQLKLFVLFKKNIIVLFFFSPVCPVPFMFPVYLESSLISSAKTSYSWQFNWFAWSVWFSHSMIFFLGFSNTKHDFIVFFPLNFPCLHKTSKIICHYKNIPSWFSKWAVTE